jgi:hypothetical protein
MFLVMICGFVTVTQSVPRQNPNAQVDRCVEIRQALDDYLQIKVGMTRREVEKQFKEDGGMQVRGQTRYVYKKCAYVQVEISFKLADSRKTVESSPDDIVTKVSKPYLAYMAVD